jgi:hypothetical protein
MKLCTLARILPETLGRGIASSEPCTVMNLSSEIHVPCKQVGYSILDMSLQRAHRVFNHVLNCLQAESTVRGSSVNKYE